MNDAPQNLGRLRDAIDRADRDLIRALGERFTLIEQISRVKAGAKAVNFDIFEALATQPNMEDSLHDLVAYALLILGEWHDLRNAPGTPDPVPQIVSALAPDVMIGCGAIGPSGGGCGTGKILCPDCAGNLTSYIRATFGAET